MDERWTKDQFRDESSSYGFKTGTRGPIVNCEKKRIRKYTSVRVLMSSVLWLREANRGDQMEIQKLRADREKTKMDIKRST